MSDYLRKGFLLGLGAAVSGKEKLQQMVNELVEKNELTQDQARTVMQNFMEKGELKKDEWDAKQFEQTKKRAMDAGLATKEDVDELRDRIAVLEGKLNENNSGFSDN